MPKSSKNDPLKKNSSKHNHQDAAKDNGKFKNLKAVVKIRDIKDEFMVFLWEYSVVGLAIGVIIGGAVNAFVQSFVNGVLTPLIQVIFPFQEIKNLAYTYNGVTFSFGPLISAFLNLLLVAMIIFLSVKFLFFKGGKIDRSKISKS